MKTREERFKHLIEKGYTYNSINGLIYKKNGDAINTPHNKGYVRVGITKNKKSYNLMAHHFAWYWVHKNFDINQIDHINGVRNDNRISNLRNVNHNENQWNRTKAKGYYYNNKKRKFVSQITINYKVIHLGYFDNENSAREAYLNAKEKYHII
jgi:hypothetical protein